MEQSLSVVLPVHDAQGQLVAVTHELLDVLPELTPHFEVVIVDDGSSDQTAEIAHELSRRFPQIRVIWHRRALGQEAAVRSGIRETRGDVVFVQEELMVRCGDLRRLWALRNDPQLVMARTEPEPRPLDSALLQRLTRWGQALSSSTTQHGGRRGLQMIRRRAVSELGDVGQDQLAISRLERTDAAADSSRQGTSPKFLSRLKDLALGE